MGRHDTIVAHRLATLVHGKIVRLVRQLVELINRQRAFSSVTRMAPTCCGGLELCKANA